MQPENPTKPQSQYKGIPDTSAPDSTLTFRILQALFSKTIRVGNLRIIDVHGGLHDFGDNTGSRVCVHFKKISAYWKLLLNPDLFLGEIFMDGELTIEEGTIADFLEIILENLTVDNGSAATRWMQLLNTLDLCTKRLLQINTPSRAQANVGYHYDLSPNLYELFLDSERQYSCAYFESDSETLEDAQMKKMQHIVSKLLVNPDHHVLDIGCGWGGLARFIARKTGARVTGITLSKEQLSYAKTKTCEEGLSDLVKFELCDYRDLDGVYDRVVSVGMFEHVGVNHYRTFFQTIRRLIGEQGVALLHTIGRSTGPSTTNPWIRKYIFPGGYIPALSEVIPHVEKSGLILTDLEVFRLHYAKTLREWRNRFMHHRAQAQAIYDERFCRMWEFYLACSEASFKYFGNIVFQIQLAKHQEAVPLTRNYLYRQT